MNNIFYKIKSIVLKSIFLAMPFGGVGIGIVSCTDKFDDKEGTMPSWLGSNIYDYLTERGDCNYYLRLIDDNGLKDVMQLTGSNTVFFWDDEAFERYFMENNTTYDQLPQSMKSLFMNISVINNAQLIERLAKDDKGNYIFRNTTNMAVTDTIPIVSPEKMIDNNYFAPFKESGKSMKLLQDATDWTLVQFTPDAMNYKELKDEDLQFVMNNPEVTINVPYLFSNRVAKQDIVCKNGYLHELENVLEPAETMAGYIRKTENLSEFARQMNRFAIPVFYKKIEGDSIYELRYFNDGKRPLTKDNDDKAAPGKLFFDPGWNKYATTSSYQLSLGCMFAPTNEAMKQFLSPSGDGADFYKAFGSWDNIPTSMIADIVNANMKADYFAATKTQIDNNNVKDENGYTVDIKCDNIIDKYVGRNGIVYVSNKVLMPQDYRTVMGAAKINKDNSIFNLAISNTDYSWYQYILRAPKNLYYFFITPDEYCKNYVDPVTQGYSNLNYHATLDFGINSSNAIAAIACKTGTNDTIVDTKFPLYGGGSTMTNKTYLKTRMEDIIGTQVVVWSREKSETIEQAIANGQHWFITNSNAPLYISSLTNGGQVMGGGNSTALTIQKTFPESGEYTNGKSYSINGLVQNTYKSTAEVLKENFGDFYELCAYCGFFTATPSTTTHSLANLGNVSFLSRYHYTIYAPTDAAIQKAINDGIIHSISEIEAQKDAKIKLQWEAQLENFLKYHFQDYSTFIEGEKVTNANYLTSAINNKNKFYQIYVTNTGNAITIKDGKGNTHIVNTSGKHNLLARDIEVNAKTNDAAVSISTSAYTVIHQLNDVLQY